jgi:hypothetical protein
VRAVYVADSVVSACGLPSSKGSLSSPGAAPTWAIPIGWASQVAPQPTKRSQPADLTAVHLVALEDADRAAVARGASAGGSGEVRRLERRSRCEIQTGFLPRSCQPT